MSKYLFNLFFISLFTLQISACGGGKSGSDVKVITEDKTENVAHSTSLNYFYFLHSNNPQLSSDIYVPIEGNSLTAHININTPIENLVATFNHDGAAISVNGIEQVSGTTSNDFSNIVTYTVTAQDGSKQHYEVEVVLEGEAIVQGTNLDNFYFLRSNNPQLSSDIYVPIEGDSLKARVNFDTPIENLVATFAHDGATISVNGIAQVSGTTSNDFSNIVTYTVATKDGTKQDYQVELFLFTGLPIINLSTENKQTIVSKDDYILGTVSVTSTNSDFAMETADMKIRGRGNSTWAHPKKPYQMKLINEAEMLAMPEDKKWLFIAEYSDKTLLRNTTALEMGHISKLDWTPASTFAEVVLNGQYNGTYNITQKVEVSDNRLALGDTGYLLEIDQPDRLDPDDVYFYSNNFMLNIKAPDLAFGSTEHQYIEDLIKDFEDALHGQQFKDPELGYAKYIDIDSFIDWYLISEITKNVDSKFFSSIYLNVIPGQKIKMGPLWDFDLAFGNTDYADSQYYHGFWVKDHTWYRRLFQDPAFVSKVKTRFAYFKDKQQYIVDKIDQRARYLDYAQQENDKKWQTIGIYVWPNPVVFDTYQEEVAHLKNWYVARMNWLDNALNNL